MSDAAGGSDRLDPEPLLEILQPVPQAFPASENDGHDRYVHMVDQVGGKKLADCRGSSADANIQAVGSLPGDRQGLGGAGVDEMEGRPACHLDRGPGMMREDEHRSVKRRVIAPPAFPILVRDRKSTRLNSSHVEISYA